MEADLLGTSRASQIAGISPNWLRHLIKSGQIDALPTQLGFLVKRSDAERLAQMRAEKTRGRRAAVA